MEVIVEYNCPPSFQVATSYRTCHFCDYICIVTFTAASKPPLGENVKRPLPPFGAYFFWSALYLLEASPE